jgi:hypothetical protein
MNPAPPVTNIFKFAPKDSVLRYGWSVALNSYAAPYRIFIKKLLSLLQRCRSNWPALTRRRQTAICGSFSYFGQAIQAPILPRRWRSSNTIPPRLSKQAAWQRPGSGFENC